MLSQDSGPECDATNLDSSQKRRGPFSVACSNTAPAFEVKYSILDQVAQFIESVVIIALKCPVLFWWNNRSHLLLCGLLKDGIGIVATVSKKVISA